MKLFQLDQNEYYDFTKPDAVNSMLISAVDENQARLIAFDNEQEHRDGAQCWDDDSATCQEITLPELESGVFLVS